MKIIKRGINAVIPFLLANVYLLARCPKWQVPLVPLIITLLIVLDMVVLAMPLLSLKNIQTKGIKRCQRGCENLYSFLVATAFSAVVLILMIVGVVDVSGIPVHTDSCDRSGDNVLGWNNQDISIIETAWDQMACYWNTVRMDTCGTFDSPWQTDKACI